MRLLTNIFGTILLILNGTFSVDSFSQSLPDNRLVTTDKEVNFAFSDKRGIKADNGIIYMVDTDLQTLTAFENKKAKWSVNIIKPCELPDVGPQEKQKIRYIKLSKDNIDVTYGKHDYATVDIKNGKVTCLGSD